MITIRHATDRGKTKTDWLNSLHTFSFADYYDTQHMGFNNLRVINEDTVQPGMGFGMHSHHDMEIISFVVDGALEHKDSLGNGSVIKPGEIQKMSAGSGVKHSEFNPSETNLLHFLQIWIIPDKMGIPPAYEQKTIPQNIQNKFLLIGSPTGGEHAVTIQQNVNLYVAYLTANTSIEQPLKQHQHAWIQVIKGAILLNNNQVSAGDGAAIQNESLLKIHCDTHSEILLFIFD